MLYHPEGEARPFTSAAAEEAFITIEVLAEKLIVRRLAKKGVF